MTRDGADDRVIQNNVFGMEYDWRPRLGAKIGEQSRSSVGLPVWKEKSGSLSNQKNLNLARRFEVAFGTQSTSFIYLLLNPRGKDKAAWYIFYPFFELPFVH